MPHKFVFGGGQWICEQCGDERTAARAPDQCHAPPPASAVAAPGSRPVRPDAMVYKFRLVNEAAGIVMENAELLVDTGTSFGGTLPAAQCRKLQLEPHRVATTRLADGKEMQKMMFKPILVQLELYDVNTPGITAEVREAWVSFMCSKFAYDASAAAAAAATATATATSSSSSSSSSSTASSSTASSSSFSTGAASSAVGGSGGSDGSPKRVRVSRVHVSPVKHGATEIALIGREAFHALHISYNHLTQELIFDDVIEEE